MGFPSPATDYQENRLSLDQHCNTGAPGVFFFRSDTYSFREGIKPGALLIVDFGGTPVDGSLVLCVLEQEFRIRGLGSNGTKNQRKSLPSPFSPFFPCICINIAIT